MTNLNESGRSMIEMLGVLAIIGVLSVGGIAGYTQAMKKYRSNEITNTIAVAAVMCQTGQEEAAKALETEFVNITDCTDGTVTFAIKATSYDDKSVQENLERFGSFGETPYSYTLS